MMPNSDRTGIGCQPIPGNTLFWSQVSLHRNECLQWFLIVKAHLLYKCLGRASTSRINTTDQRFCPKWLTTWRELSLPKSKQAGCIYSMTMPPHIKLRNWETIWLSRRSMFCLTYLSQPWPCPLWFFVISFVNGVHGRNKVYSMPGPSKRSQFTGQMGASLWAREVLQEMDPKAEEMYRSWRRVFWRTKIEIVWFMRNSNEIKTKWQTLLIQPCIIFWPSSVPILLALVIHLRYFYEIQIYCKLLHYLNFKKYVYK